MSTMKEQSEKIKSAGESIQPKKKTPEEMNQNPNEAINDEVIEQMGAK